VKLSICVLTILSPVLGWAQLAGNWAGAVVDSQGAHRITLHISGPFTAMKASASIPDQKLLNAPVESITFSDSTLEFSIPASDVRYSGVLNDNGAIAGTLAQHGAEMRLVLARVAANPGALLGPDGPGGVIEKGRYHDTLSGVEFDLPSGWFIQRTDPDTANPGGVRIFADPSGRAMIFTAWMFKTETDPETIPKLLSRVVAYKIAQRAGQTPPGSHLVVANYKIREGSVEQTTLLGHPAVRAIGEWEQNGKSFAEYLTWIYTEHTRTHFVLRATAENLPSLQAPLEQILQSAQIP
jgi:hypothetical protein